MNDFSIFFISQTCLLTHLCLYFKFSYSWIKTADINPDCLPPYYITAVPFWGQNLTFRWMQTVIVQPLALLTLVNTLIAFYTAFPISFFLWISYSLDAGLYLPGHNANSPLGDKAVFHRLEIRAQTTLFNMCKRFQMPSQDAGPPSSGLPCFSPAIFMCGICRWHSIPHASHSRSCLLLYKVLPETRQINACLSRQHFCGLGISRVGQDGSSASRSHGDAIKESAGACKFK